ncbi:MAG: AAA family ATPase [Chloroflexi bacterium]|nr:AAA family ATPase [Chloroflexota bacterium]
MKLIRASVRNYRIHHDAVVEFDPERTLIGGANETGKSTLVEAIHRALFLKAKVTGESVEAMRSHMHVGSPEVEVHFEAGGAQYVVVKRFHGHSGAATLHRVGGQTWHDDAAEEKLTELLQVQDVGKGRGIGERVERQWAHLWVRQGRSGSNPRGEAEDHHDALLQRLQSSSGAVVAMSPLDERLVQHFAALAAQSLRSAGKRPYKKGTPLFDAAAQCAALEQALAEVEAQWAKIEQARVDFTAAQEDLTQIELDAAAQAQERVEIAERRRQCDVLRARVNECARAADVAGARLAERESIEAEILSHRRRIDELARSVAPRNEKAVAERAALLQAQAVLNEARQETQTRQAAADEAQRRLDFAQARARCTELAAEVADLERNCAQAAALHAERAALEARLAALPVVSPTDVDDIAALARDLDVADAELRAMAVSLELLAADVDAIASLNGAPLAPGEEVRLTDDVVFVHGALRLRIRPGGGAAMDEARARAQTLRSEFDAQLTDLQLRDPAHAQAVLAERTRITGDVEKIEARLHGMEADLLDERLFNAQDELGIAQQQFAGYESAAEATASAGDEAAAVDQSADLPMLEAAQKAAAQAIKAARSRERAEKARVDELAATVDALERDVQRDAQLLENEKVVLAAALARHGDDAARAAALALARAENDLRAFEFAAQRDALEALFPQALDDDERRSERARARAEQRRADAQSRKAVAAAAMASDGAVDPEARRTELRGDLQRARSQQAALEAQARAHQRIDEFFQQEKSALSMRFTEPLAARIGDYLQAALGSAAQARVEWDDGLSELRLARGAGGEFSFETLSGGTRELFAAAVRLAIAELLAVDHGGSLPVVFDDAFTNCDPERVRAVERRRHGDAAADDRQEDFRFQI